MAVKVTLVWPAARRTLVGTVAALTMPLLKLMVRSAILGVGTLTVPVEVEFSGISAGLRLTVSVALVTVADTPTLAEVAPPLAKTTLPAGLPALLVPATRTEIVFVDSPLVCARVRESAKSTPLVET